MFSHIFIDKPRVKFCTFCRMFKCALARTTGSFASHSPYLQAIWDENFAQPIYVLAGHAIGKTIIFVLSYSGQWDRKHQPRP